MKRVAPFALLLGLLCCAGAGSKPAHAQEFGPGDIDRLAAMSKADPALFKNSIVGVARFAGTGTVLTTSTEWGSRVTLPGQVEVSCMADAPGVAAGDRVRVTGVIGSASTAGGMARINEIGKALGQPATVMQPEVNSLGLMTSNCAVRKIR